MGSSARSSRSPNLGNTIQPYRMHVSQKYLDLTKQKLELTRLPREPQRNGQDQWSYGVAKSDLEPLVDHWAEDYDWRAQEVYFNDTLPQFRIGINGARLHFVHKRSPYPHAIPLLFVHGWPESFITVSHMVDALCESSTSSYANALVPAFHVVAPSIPGFGFSDPVHEDMNCVAGTAEMLDSLMKALGYARYMLHGSGWGFKVCRMIATSHSDSCLAIHTTNPEVPAPRSSVTYNTLDSPSGGLVMPDLRTPVLEMGPPHSTIYPSGATTPVTPVPAARQPYDRPQTLSYALCDSPTGLLSHIVDIIRPPSRIPSAIAPHPDSNAFSTPWTPTAFVTWTMMYWLPGPEVALRWLANSAPMEQSMWSSYSHVPLAVSHFGNRNLPHSPGLWVEAYHRIAMVKRRPGNVRFPAWERPIDLVLDLRELALLIGSHE